MTKLVKLLCVILAANALMLGKTAIANPLTADLSIDVLKEGMGEVARGLDAAISARRRIGNDA